MGRLKCELTKTINAGSDMLFHPVGRRLVAADLQTGQGAGVYSGHVQQVTTTVAHPSLEQVVSGGLDCMVCVWGPPLGHIDHEIEEDGWISSD